MIDINADNRQECCGCSACAQICPQKCISMQEDAEGFAYPQVDLAKCINCGLCEKVCPIIQKANLYSPDEHNLPRAIGGWHKDESVRLDSSSGGAFTLFAEYILANGGIVYGCTLNEAFRAEHIGVDNMNDLSRLRGSKYLQSDINGVYAEIKGWLKQGRLVLFTGTPCQAAGLHSFLQRKYDNLYVVDFICHGVPSPKVFRSYIKSLEKKLADTVISFKFRCKDCGWNPTGLQLGTLTETESGKLVRLSPGYKDAYMNGFLDDVYLRPSCYACEFKCLPKYYSDITIADFWGVKKVDPKLFDGRGTSLLLINSEHGEEIFDKVKDKFFHKECDLQSAIRRNKSLIKSVAWNPHRERFFQDYAAMPFEKVQKKYMSAFTWAAHKALKMGWGIFESFLHKTIKCLLKLFGQTWNEEQWQNFMQFVRFSMVGISNVIVSYLINILTLLVLTPAGLKFDYIAANTTAFVLSVLWSFYWNNRLVFTLKFGEHRSTWRTLAKTYVVYGFTGIILNNVLSTIWIYGLHMSKFVAPLCNLPISVPINFLLNKFWTYNGEKN